MVHSDRMMPGRRVGAQTAPVPKAAPSARFRPYSGIMWLASYPRSGNTWTRAFLFNIFRVVAGECGPMNLGKLHGFAPWDRAAALYPEFVGQSVTGLTREQIAVLRPKLQESIAARAPGFAFLKTHSGRFIDCGQPVINDAVLGGAVYIIRNPLDVAVSYARHLGSSIDRVIAIMARPGWQSPSNERSIQEIVGSWSENVRSWTEPPTKSLFVVRYENAAARPFEVFAQLSRHVGLNPDRIQLGLAVEFSSFNRLQQQERETGFPEEHFGPDSHFRTGQTGGWREHLTPRQIDRIVKVHGEQMQRFGYLP